MKLLLLLNNDIHSLKALSLLSPYLKKHQIFILLSRKSQSLKNVSKGTVANQTFRRTFGNSNFFETHIHLGTLTFQKNLNHQNFLENFDLRQRPNRLREIIEAEAFDVAKLPQIIQEDLNSKFEFTENINSKTSVEKISNFAPQLIISIRFGQILQREIIQIPQFGVVNLHSGILPAYRGVMASFWAILRMEKEIGTTLHYIEDATIDTGRVIAISRREVDFNASLIENISALYEAGCANIIEFLKKVEKGEKIELTEQKNLGVSAYYSYPTEEDLEKFAKVMRLI